MTLLRSANELISYINENINQEVEKNDRKMIMKKRYKIYKNSTFY